jgi:4-phospho-D-threonate 3-dehydrogenase / 4-phospho-D-erythronate 3-dehydrogenase
MDNNLLGVTMGDSSGVGPEILLKAFAHGEILHPAVAYGDIEALQFYNERLGYGVNLRRVAGPSEYEPGPLNVIDLAILTRDDVTPGELSRRSGAAAREYVVAATRAALAKEIAAMVTLPMNKEATQLSDPDFVGHTELIGAVCGVKDVTIMLASDQLIVTHVSTHMSLLNAIRAAKYDRICTILRMTSDAVCKLIPNARIAVAGLNPHAGENAGDACRWAVSSRHSVLHGCSAKEIRCDCLHVSRSGACAAKAARFRGWRECCAWVAYYPYVCGSWNGF